MGIITLLKPQLSKQGSKFAMGNLNREIPLRLYNYFAIVDGKATFVRGKVTDPNKIRVGKIVITGESKNGNAQFAKLIEMLEFMPIEKHELVHAVAENSEDYSFGLFSSRYGRTDDVYTINMNIYNRNTCTLDVDETLLYAVHLAVPYNSFYYVFYKTKYGIKVTTFSTANFSFKYEGFYKNQHKYQYTINHTDTMPILTRTLLESVNIPDEMTHQIQMVTYKGYDGSVTKLAGMAEIKSKEINVCNDTDFDYFDDVTGTMAYGNYENINGKCINKDLIFNHGFPSGDKVTIRKYPQRIKTENIVSIEYEGKIYKHKTFDIYCVDVDTIGRIKFRNDDMA